MDLSIVLKRHIVKIEVGENKTGTNGMTYGRRRRQQWTGTLMSLLMEANDSAYCLNKLNKRIGVTDP